MQRTPRLTLLNVTPVQWRCAVTICHNLLGTPVTLIKAYQISAECDRSPTKNVGN